MNRAESRNILDNLSIEDSENSVKYLYMLALCNFYLGEYDKSISDFDKCVQMNYYKNEALLFLTQLYLYTDRVAKAKTS